MTRLFAAALAATALVAAPAGKTPTFYKDVMPVLANHCQSCHRAGEIGPMAFTDYTATRPWAKAIKAAVSSKKMPPWFADPKHGKFENDRSMPQADIDTLVAWADGGAPEGNKKDAPAPKKWVEGWNIPTPDMVVGMTKAVAVPADSKIDYQYIVVPLNLTEDKWVQMVEARPSDRSVVHHLVVFVRDPQSKWLREAEPGVPYVPPRQGQARRIDVGGGGNEILHIYTPGNLPDIFKPGQAKLIPKGSDLVFQMHYTSTKKSTEDLTKIGMVWAKEPPKERIMTLAVANETFVIPPGADNHPASGTLTFPNDATVLSFFPHMHLRGKAMEFTLTPPGGEKLTLLNVPKYDFNWQLTYKLAEPLVVKPGTKMQVTGYFDNSPNNPFNPDPKSEVRWGEQSWEEMMYGFFDFAVDARYDRRGWMSRKPLPPTPSGAGAGQ